MTRWASLVLMVALLAVPVANAAADTYYVYNQWGGTWHDANKTWNGDSNLCWAAAASNVLDWRNWGTATLNTEASIFNYFKGYWTNDGSLPQYGWQWWFDGTNGAAGEPGWAQLKVSGGGNFWPTVNFDNYFHTKWSSPSSPTGNLMATVDSYLHSGYGVTLGIYLADGLGGWYGHALTAWGFDYAGSGSNRTYTQIYVTDSDDSFYGKKGYQVSWNATDGWWDFESGYLTGWHLSDVEALARNPVPIPASLLLLGSGLLGLAAWRRKSCHN